MDAAVLRKTLERHRRLLRSDSVHLLGDEQGARVASALVSGHVMRSTLPPLGARVNCTVNAEVLLSLVPAQGDLTLREQGSDLLIESKRSRGKVPTDPDASPVLPQPSTDASAHLSQSEVEWLRAVLPRIALSKTSNGNSSITGDGRELRACTHDESHGAFAFCASASRFNIGITPSDNIILLDLLGEGDKLVIRPSDDNRMIVRVGDTAVVLPSLGADAPARSEVFGTCQPHWSCRTDDLAEAVSAVSTVAKNKGKESSAVRLAVQDRRLRVSAQSEAGSAAHDVQLREMIAAHKPVGLNLFYLQDVVARLPRDQTVGVYLERGDKPSPRIVLQSNVTYSLLTSGE